MRYLGEEVKVCPSLAPGVNQTAGGSHGVQTGAAQVDRQGFFSAVLAVPYSATLATAEICTIEAYVEQSDVTGMGSGVTTLATATPLVLTGADATVAGVLEKNFSLNEAKRYLRAVAHVTLGAAGTDTCRVAGLILLGNSDTEPI